MNQPFVSPRSQRTLSVAFAFHDAFLGSMGADAPLLDVPLDVSIPEFQWSAFYSDTDRTHRFSSLTLTTPPPAKPNLAVRVVDPDGGYENHEPILITLPLAIPPGKVPERADFLISRPLWPTPLVRPPFGETAVRGSISSPTAQPVSGLKVEIWIGPALVPPAGTPYTRTNAAGDFLYRFPLLPTDPDPAKTAALRIRVEGGLVSILPAAVTVGFGRTAIIPFQRN